MVTKWRPSRRWRAAGILWRRWSLSLAVGCGQTEVVTVDGSSTVFLISAAVAEKFHEVDPNVNVVVSQIGHRRRHEEVLRRRDRHLRRLAADQGRGGRGVRSRRASSSSNCRSPSTAWPSSSIPQNDWCDSLTVEQLKTIWRTESEGSVMKWSDVESRLARRAVQAVRPGRRLGHVRLLHRSDQRRGEELPAATTRPARTTTRWSPASPATRGRSATSATATTPRTRTS